MPLTGSLEPGGPTFCSAAQTLFKAEPIKVTRRVGNEMNVRNVVELLVDAALRSVLEALLRMLRTDDLSSESLTDRVAAAVS